MGKFEIEKGKRGERDVFSRLNPVIAEAYSELGWGETPKLIRNLKQYQIKGGYDAVGVGWLALEVKNHKVTHLKPWWRETLRQCGTGQVPILAYKVHRKGWFFRMYGELRIGEGKYVSTPVDVDETTFKVWFKEVIKERAVAPSD